LDRIVIKPVAVYEDLPKDEVKERIRSESRKKGGISESISDTHRES